VTPRPRRWVAHVPYLTLLLIATLVLFRTWLGGRYPSGTDSGFLYSALPLYQAHGLQLFTVWLPVPMGQIQQYSLYWLLTMVMVVLRSPLVTYEVSAVGIALVAAFGMYCLSWAWCHSRLGALCAAGAYAFSPLAVAQWLDGHLDVATSIAVGPIAVWALLEILNTGSRRAAVALGLCGSALYLLTSGQGAYWLVALAVVALVRLVVARRERRKLIARALSGGAITLITFGLTSAVQLVPLALGAGAPFLQPGQSYYIESLLVHIKYSLPFLKDLVGVPREVYLPRGTNLSLAPFTSSGYIVPQAIVLCISLSALAARRAWLARTLFLLAVASWLLAAGPHGPIGAIYVDIWDHVTYFRFLRVPNRWLMLASFSVAVLLALAIAQFEQRILPSAWVRGWVGAAARILRAPTFEGRQIRLDGRRRGVTRPLQLVGHWGLAAMAVTALLLVNAGAVLARGLPTMTPPVDYRAAYTSLRDVPGDWRVVTTPVYQAWMDGPADGDDESIMADLGYTSTYYDSRNVIARGGWDPNASQFATAVYDMVEQGTDHDLAGLLGAAAVKYVVLDPEPAVEAVSGPPESVSKQNAFFRTQRGFVVQASYGGFTILRNTMSESQAFEPTSACVVAGGYDVLEDLSETPGFSFSRTAVLFADQLVQMVGISGLDRVARLSDCLIAGPGGMAELAVLANLTATVNATALAPGGWQQAPVDPLLDSESTAADSVAVPTGGSLRWTVSVRRPGRYRLWARVLVAPGSGGLGLALDGGSVGHLSTMASAIRGYRWLPSRPLTLTRGRHTVTMVGLAGGPTQVVQLALARGTELSWTPPAMPKSAVIEDVDTLNPTSYGLGSISGLSPLESGTWTHLPGLTVTASPHAGAVIEQTIPIRTYFALAQMVGPTSVDPNHAMVLEVQAPPNHLTFDLTLYFGNGTELVYPFRDSLTRPVVITLNPRQRLPNSVVPDWSDVTRITVSTDSKSPLGGPLHVEGPFAGNLPTRAPYLIGKLPAGSGGRSKPGTSLSGMVTSSAQIDNIHPGILVFSQAYNSGWRLAGATTSLHTIALGFANAYLVTGSAHRARLTFALALPAQAMTLMSLAFWLGGLAIVCWRRPRTRSPSARRSTQWGGERE
jgi:hypothetical protein